MQVAIIGVPYDLDQHNRGKGAAPAALLGAGLTQQLEALGCTLTTANAFAHDVPAGTQHERIGAVMQRLAAEVAQARAGGAFPLVLGGDCLAAIGVVAGLRDGSNTGIAWIDAHGDYNTPAISTSHYLGGMPLACVAGHGLDDLRNAAQIAAPVPEANIVAFDVRDLDPAEEQALVESAVLMVRGADLHAAEPLQHALDRLADVKQLYLHVDIDVLRPADAPGVDFRTPDGMALDELCTLVARIVAQGNVAALALTAVNPERDDGTTVRSALAVIGAALAPLARQPASNV